MLFAPRLPLFLRLALIALPLLFTGGGQAADLPRLGGQQLHFEHFDQLQGLNSRTITCGLQDTRGILWFGSEDGLIRYDGYTFQEFVFDPADAHSLSANLVYALAEDHHGQIWVGTVGGGLNRYDPKTGRFVRYQHDPAEPRSLSHNAVVSLLVDDQDNLWIGTEGGGLNRLGPDRQEFIRYRHNPDARDTLANDTIWHLYQDRRQRIWIGTFGGGLDLYLPETEGFRHFRHQPNDPESLSSDTIGAIFEDRQGQLWIGSTDAGLNRFDPDTGKAVRFQNRPEDFNSIGHNHIWTIHEDDQGILWLTSFGGGLILFDPARGQFASYRHQPTVATSLSSDLIWFILESRDKILWLGTDGGGLNKLVKRSLAFNHILTDASRPISLKHDGINAVAEDRDGMLWLANDGGGFQRFDPSGNTITRLFHHEPAAANTLVSDLTEAILVDRLGIVWIGTYNGLSAFNPRTGLFRNYRHEPLLANSLSDNRIWALHEDQRGNLWVGTRNGLNRLSPDRETITRLMHQPDRQDSLSDNGIWVIYQDRRQTIWVGTDSGLNRLRPDGQTFDRFAAGPADNGLLSHGNVTAIHEDRQGNLWVGTNGGLNRLVPESSRFEQFTLASGLGGNSIRGILEDNRGTLWITTARGLTCYEPDRHHFAAFDRHDGLQGGEFSRAHLRLHDGRMVIGGREGLNIFDPQRITRNTTMPLVRITGLTVAGSPMPPSVLASDSPVMIDYNANTIVIEFAVLDYSNPASNSHAYKLEGFDRDWIMSGSNRSATYTNLDGGRYTFKVKGANNHELWNEQGATLHFVVADPPWQRWWAILAYIVFLTSVIYAITSRWAARQRQRLVAMEQANEELQNEINQRRRVEQALQESEKRLSMALEASQEGIWELYPQSGETYFSPAWFSMLGYASDEFPHSYTTWASLLHADDREKTETFIRQFIADHGESFTLEFRMKAKDGGYRWIQAVGKTFARDAAGRITHMCGIHLDITERREWLSVIETSELRYRDLFDEAPIMYVIIENKAGEAWIRDANNTFITTLGYRREEVINTLLSTYYGPRSRSLILQKANYDQIVTRTFQPEERELLTKDGRLVNCLLHASPEIDANGKVTAIRAMFLDITAKKQAEQDRERLENALHQAQKMEAIGTLAGGIAHDFNNILSAILGYCELLLLEWSEGTPVHTKVKQIHLAGLRARDLVQQILTFSRRNERRLEPMQVGPVVLEAMKLLRSTLPTSIAIVEHIGERLPNITADPTQVHQIVMNLCTNSAQAMADGGRLTVSLDEVTIPPGGIGNLPQLRPGRHLRLTVADNGEGMTPETLRSIFTPYFTTKAKNKGTGLGLAVVHGIVQSYGGAIEVESAPGKGSIFSVLIPATEAQPMSGNRNGAVMLGNNEHVLLVDDEAMLVDVGRQLLTSLGYRVTGITSSQEALETFRARPDEFDLLISDMTMPEMTGERLAGRLRLLRPGLPVILLTGFSEKLQGRSKEELGIDGLLFKPVDKNELAAVIRDVLDAKDRRG